MLQSVKYRQNCAMWDPGRDGGGSSVRNIFVFWNLLSEDLGSNFSLFCMKYFRSSLALFVSRWWRGDEARMSLTGVWSRQKFFTYFHNLELISATQYSRHWLAVTELTHWSGSSLSLRLRVRMTSAPGFPLTPIWCSGSNDFNEHQIYIVGAELSSVYLGSG